MKTIEVFDPALCCSTGVCGPNVDPALARFAADLAWLTGRGVTVQRYNLAQQPGAFVEREPVKSALQTKGEDCLPLVLAGGEAVSDSRYPSRAELARFAGVEAPVAVYTPATDELVAIGAAVASNCEPCLEYHVGRARELGVVDDDIAHAVRTAALVKETPARSILRTADRLLDAAAVNPVGIALPVVAAAASAGECGPDCGCASEPSAESVAEAGSGSCC